MPLQTCTKCGGTIHGEVCLLCELFAVGQVPGGTPTTGWPLESEALAVHPSQVEAANARAKRHGINVVYKRNGNAIIPDRNERRKLLKLEGYVDKSSFTGY